ncbi:putative [Helicobacter pylori J99]|uniref:Putative n=1 Tax=Helicobacter pylori (strain J99 / ATCC 700824) TaxID=85963 RepID=Q9ZJY7_HELPJ|nr:putative [Helicobacter pylori J99]
MFVKNLKREMEEIENSDPNQNNPLITATMGIGGAAISIFFPDTKPIVDGVKPLAEKGLQEAFRKDKLAEGQKFSISSLRFLSLFCIVVAAVIGLCLIWSFNGWSFWEVTGLFLFYVVVCSAPTFPNIFIANILDDR